MMYDNDVAMQSCLRFPVNVRSLPPKGVELHLTADAREKKALAKAHDLIAVKEFSAVFHVRPWKKQGVRVEGDIEAKIEQICVITSEILQNKMQKHFEACFVPQNSRLARSRSDDEIHRHELFLDPEGDDAPEIFTGNEIDVGSLVEEFFELAIDRYPRKENISLQAVWKQCDDAETGSSSKKYKHKNRIPARVADEAENETKDRKNERPASPFAALKYLKKK